MLLLSYIIETLASELLMKGYSAYNRYIARYHFFGSEKFPLEMLPSFLNKLTWWVTCNSDFYVRGKL